MGLRISKKNLPRVTSIKLKDLKLLLEVTCPPNYYVTRGRLSDLSARVSQNPREVGIC